MVNTAYNRVKNPIEAIPDIEDPKDALKFHPS
jgi:hypothetical protein